ncbi:MAG: carboxymuconolactone decarboxylase family protein [Acidimicrobiia bacterium]|nr:carboxymuconolactone decarboxylase family protein [Acidimicrobiia bacterium]
MKPRVSLRDLVPDAFTGVTEMERYNRRHVDPMHYEMLKVRASILNGCAFCLDMHVTDWLRRGADPRKVTAVTTWHDAPFFDAQERALLALTDEVTRLGEQGVTDATWDEAIVQFGAEGVGNLLFAIATINVWNRLQISTRTPPPIDPAG